MIEEKRYIRHISLPEIGHSGQRRLKEARVLIVGLGGLGSPASLYLAASGVGTLGLADFDRVEESNLHRQVLYNTEDIGKQKVLQAYHHLKIYNPELSIIKFENGITEANSDDIVKNFDLIVDATDNFASRYLINRIAHQRELAVIYGAIHKFEGQVSVFDSRKGPCYNCIYPENKTSLNIADCEQIGVLGALPGIIGTMQAIEAIKIILCLEPILYGKLLLYNAIEQETRKISLQSDPDCQICSKSYDSSMTKRLNDDEHTKVPELISSNQLKDRIDNDTDSLSIIDVRTPVEYLAGRIPGSINIPLDQLDEHIETLAISATHIVYCQSGTRSRVACNKLLHSGYKDVKNLIGGYIAWQMMASKV